MNKEMITQDLPQILTDLIHTQCIKSGSYIDWKKPAKFWLDKIDWKLASNEERLAFAKLMYGDLPIGTEIKGILWCDELIEKPIIYERGGIIWVSSNSTKDDYSIDLYRDGKWAEIISRPDEVEKPTEVNKPPLGIMPEFIWIESRQKDLINTINRYKESGLEYPKEWDIELSKYNPPTKPKYTFKVGDRPKWTPELIKQLPYGTVLECAYYLVQKRFTYDGQDIVVTDISITTKEDGREYCFYYAETISKYAKIISLPTEQKEEFKAGETVEWKTSQTKERWSKAEYHGKNRFGLHVVSENTVAACVEEIRKLDPDKKYRSAVEEICKNNDLEWVGDSVPVEIQMKYIKSMLIEALKKTVE